MIQAPNGAAQVLSVAATASKWLHGGSEKERHMCAADIYFLVEMSPHFVFFLSIIFSFGATPDSTRQ